MAINVETGEHICFGLMIGQCCASCRKKYPHLLASRSGGLSSSISQRSRQKQGKLRTSKPLRITENHSAPGT
ncbi:MAG TPA: hypothetical protein V6C81_02495 [Planktothrix sp.]|jgi:hypothetical protein